MEKISTRDLHWSILAISNMNPANRKQGLFQSTDIHKPHQILAKATYPPNWEGYSSWLLWIPWIGPFIILLYRALFEYGTIYEDVADFLSEDLELGKEDFIGKRVAVKQKQKLREERKTS